MACQELSEYYLIVSIVFVALQGSVQVINYNKVKSVEFVQIIKISVKFASFSKQFLKNVTKRVIVQKWTTEYKANIATYLGN